MNRSIGVRAHFWSLTAGRTGRTGATNAQCSFQSAPCSIQSLIVVFLCVGQRLVGRERRHPPRGILFRDSCRGGSARACPAQSARRFGEEPARRPEGPVAGSPCASTRLGRDRESSCPTGSGGCPAGNPPASAPRPSRPAAHEREDGGADTHRRPARSELLNPPIRHLPIFQSSNLPISCRASEQESSSKSDHALGLREDSRDATEVRVAQRAVRIGVVRNVQRVEEVRPNLSAPRSETNDLHD